MAKGKQKTTFFCKECGFESPKWLGQCPGCKEWDSFVEEPVVKTAAGRSVTVTEHREPSKLSEIVTNDEVRTLTGIGELDRVLGGGIVTGSLVLVGGDPGIGKSTLLLQMCKQLAEAGKDVLYVSGEESVKQIKMRADRLGTFQKELFLLSETDLDIVTEVIGRKKPEIVIIDSIQTMYREEIGSAPGSVSQVRETTSTLMRLAKSLPVSIFIVGHVTKEGVVAGPRVLEHMVDTVLYFEGDGGASYRFLRGVKNRFGSTDEIGVFEMRGNGLVEVPNPSEYMLAGKPKQAPGSIVVCSIEGTRPILIEVQALVCQTNFNMPRRTSTGTDYNRVNLLMAVIEKRMGVRMGDCDAYINVAGGMRIHEPALDLGIILALLTSYRNQSLDDETICFGEVGLAGEVRAVNMAEQRVLEAAKLGFKRCILPKVNCRQLALTKEQTRGLELVGIESIHELLEVF
ncbi:MAG: DNA repair protein RadA [Clostridium sp.]|jgi:DNA repair protein RadA/Sms|uniref:DNA repair protein RadA n=2 Tax=Clostridia TaxID=186801 RepID=UPI000959247B|nr:MULTISPECIES: DNA repair protein RadA [unclassified Clostridium]MBS6767560.1 DNA repair protein RadA [Clostridium sp.]MEE0031678.1 DNA repair protein RadA [Lachnospiraceae bacterium]OKZ63505.1 MAG: DNA repair protein RadA [Clostridium sp. 42_12]RHQ13979.1 DNA repair protein RadA [Clostridium sp. AM49-4BH]RHV12500.1 DNA repair protein RadA [Clostridium sp. OM05-9BH]